MNTQNTLQHGAITWTDVARPRSDLLAELEQRYELHPVHVAESTQKVQHTRVECEDKYLFMVLHVPVFDRTTSKISINQVGIFLGKTYLVTIRSGDCPAITGLFEACRQNPDEATKQFKHGASSVLYGLISRLLTDISDMTERVISELDAIEELVFDNNTSDAQRIGKLRQKIVRLSRIIGPKRLILEDLAEQINSFTGQNVSKYYDNNTKAVNKLWEVVEEAKETVEIFKDADFTTSTEQTNKTLAILTLVFTFTIPITVLGTLYGMNVPLPGGLSNGAWMFLGPYTTYEVIIFASVLAATVMYVYFKRKHWF